MFFFYTCYKFIEFCEHLHFSPFLDVPLRILFYLIIFKSKNYLQHLFCIINSLLLDRTRRLYALGCLDIWNKFPCFSWTNFRRFLFIEKTVRNLRNFSFICQFKRKNFLFFPVFSLLIIYLGEKSPSFRLVHYEANIWGLLSRNHVINRQ